MNIKKLSDSDNKSFLAQTAKDYDMSLHEVEAIYEKYPDTFYEELENFIERRANNQ